MLPPSPVPLPLSASSSSAAGPSQRQQQQQQLLPLFEEFEAYPFSDDANFRAGLPTVIAAIRGKDRTPKQIDEMIARAQWFYFTRLKGANVHWDAYAEYSLEQQRERPTHTSTSLSPTPNASPRFSSLGATVGGVGGGIGAASAGNGVGGNYSGSGSKNGKGKASFENGLAQLNSLAETRRMMQSPSMGEHGSGQGMSFAMLCRLISEGRANEVQAGTINIPDGINEDRPSEAVLPSRAKPWESSSTQSTYMSASPTAGQATPQSTPATPASASTGVLYQHRDSMGSAMSSYNSIYLMESLQSEQARATSTSFLDPNAFQDVHHHLQKVSPVPQHPQQLEQQHFQHQHQHQHPHPHQQHSQQQQQQHYQLLHSQTVPTHPNQRQHIPIPLTLGVSPVHHHPEGAGGIQQFSVSPSASTPFLDPQTASTPLLSVNPTNYIADQALRADISNGADNGADGKMEYRIA